MTEFINVTGHYITLDDRCGNRFVLNPSGTNARVFNSRPVVKYLDGWPVRYLDEGEISGLPVPSPGKIFIASNIVSRLATVRGRCDVLCPDVSHASVKRDRFNNVQSVQGLVSFSCHVGDDL